MTICADSQPSTSTFHRSDSTISNWSLNAELEFPHLASEEEDWDCFNQMLGEGAPTGDQGGQASHPHAVPVCTEMPELKEFDLAALLGDMSDDEYALGQFAPANENLLAEDEEDLERLLEAKVEHARATHFHYEGFHPLALDLSGLIDYERAETATPSSAASTSPVFSELHIDIPVDECYSGDDSSQSEPPPELLIVNPRKRHADESLASLILFVQTMVTTSPSPVVNTKRSRRGLDCSDRKQSDPDEPISKRLRPRPGRRLFVEDLKRSEELLAKVNAANGSSKPKPAPVQAVNPAEISLGGDSDDWTNKAIKDEDQKSGIVSMATNPRVRRSSTRSHNTDGQQESSADESSNGVLMHVPSPTHNRGRGRPRKADSERRRREAEARLRKVAEEGGDVNKMIDPRRLHCICQMPYDDRKFYVACNECSQWFHGKCIGISERKARRLSRFVCHDCRDPQDEESDDDEEDEGEEEDRPEGDVKVEEEEEDDDEEESEDDQVDIEMDDGEPLPSGQMMPIRSATGSPLPELFCVCRTPYDESKFYVGCDGCEGWFHPACVGITQTEAESVEQYMCPQCRARKRTRRLSDRRNTQSESDFELARGDFEVLWELFEAISEHRGAWPFKEPVDIHEFPTYSRIVKNPIDLSIIEKRLCNSAYIRLSELESDLQLMFNNAKLFNVRGSAIWDCADTLEGVFREKLRETRERLDEHKDASFQSIHGMDLSNSDHVDIDPSVFDEIL